MDRLVLRFGRSVLGAFALAAMAVATEAAAEEEFRVENKVFVDDEEEPRIQSTTIFYGGIVYDYLQNPAEVTVFDRAEGRFVLLDLTRRIKTELTTAKVSELTDGLRQWARKQEDPLLKFLAEPKFDEKLEESSGELSLVSPWVSYRLVTEATDNEAICRQYREFSDWYCQLNTMLTPGARPPMARMLVNAALQQRQRFPREVHLTIRLKEGILPQRMAVRSEHVLVRRLVESDRDRVAQTDQFMAMFQAAGFQEYQEKMAE